MTTKAINDVQILFVEMQPPIVASSATLPPNSLKRAATAVTRMADALALPTTASVVPLGDESPAPIDELASIGVLVRTTISALADTACRTRVTNNQRSTVVLAGVSSEIAVLHTALDARQEGYDVVVLVDCCGGLSNRTEATALDQMRAAGVVVTNISSFFTGLVGDMASPEGGAVMATLAEFWSWGR
ncbi:isochorismatase family protein [Aurantimonas sp. HBX-1]|uniref:isochorismatase family protein n=1 Tax=Aurantimonas sp. HBX-1 TaxID=2906072 RepID=UPI001F3830E9|nr:isochorismatase family protein [Aurantimonas sp. HBX-1]UIJ73449.1 isochorismatase family protein [Aurantimonas sp. HBX-1]